MFEVQNNINYKVFINAQKKAIEVSKWIEGERIKSDPGTRYILFWIHAYAKDFKQAWNRSRCKKCKNEYCRYKNVSKCNDFSPDPELQHVNKETNN